MTNSSDAINVSIAVAVSPARAFAVFTQDIDQWWQRGPVYRSSKGASLRLEPEVGGRFLEVHANGGLTREIGRVQVWQPGERFVVEWRGSNFAAAEVTRIEVRFEPEGDGTRISVQHSGWDALPANHAARHGQQGAAFVTHLSRWWVGVLTPLQQRLGPY